MEFIRARVGKALNKDNRFKLLLISYIVVSLVDLFLTIYGRSLGLTEINPLLNIPIPWFVIVKLAGVCFVCYLLVKRASAGYARFAVSITGLVVLSNIINIGVM
jgi:hypothetical protein